MSRSDPDERAHFEPGPDEPEPGLPRVSTSNVALQRTPKERAVVIGAVVLIVGTILSGFIWSGDAKVTRKLDTIWFKNYSGPNADESVLNRPTPPADPAAPTE